MKEKVIINQDPVEVHYDCERFLLLGKLRSEAQAILSVLNLPAFVYGSLARGDVHEKSDIDIIIPESIETYLIEVRLSQQFQLYLREIVQATPNSVPKAHLHINEHTTVTCPLLPLTKNEEEFYRFSGLLEDTKIDTGLRVCGVNKKLLLISPNEAGHTEYSVIGNEKEVSKVLGVHADIINERIRVLTKRSNIGRTGVFLKQQLQPDDTFESKLKDLADQNNIIRRQIWIRK